MNTTSITHVAHLVEICVQKGISKVVISPGSRNAPLIIAFDNHPAIEVFLIHDERSAAFFALGLAERLNEPVALTCTSGSAPLNYAPAISEAYYRNIPLLILTADRPTALIDQGDGQTIRQTNVFNNYIKAAYETPDNPSEAEILWSDEVVNNAINTLMEVPAGPVQINIPLAEPLYGTQDLKAIPIITPTNLQRGTLTAKDKKDIIEDWERSERKMILIGQLPPGYLLTQTMKQVLSDPSVAILVENTSNVNDFQKICHCIDRVLAILPPEKITEYKPDLLISIGGAIVSKKIKTFLRKNKPKTTWRIGEFSFEEDTFQSLTKSFNVHPNLFFECLADAKNDSISNFGYRWKQLDFLAEEKHREFLESKGTYSDLTVFDLILDTLPDDSNLHLANSSVVRYSQLFNPISNVNYLSNRGVSGIDGSTSTAAGYAFVDAAKLNALITGDISFFYDSNALWNQYLRTNFKIILINNGGGGIFKIIDGPKKSRQSDLFFAPFKASAQKVCEAFDVKYLKAVNADEISKQLSEFYTFDETNRPCLLEIFTTDSENEQVLKDYFDYISN